MLYDISCLRVLNWFPIYMLVLVLTGWGIASVLTHWVLMSLEDNVLQASYSIPATFSLESSYCPVLCLVEIVFLYLLSFNTYAMIPRGIPIFTIPRLSLFLRLSIWLVASLSELMLFLLVKVCLFYISYVPLIFRLVLVLIEVIGYTVRLVTLGFRLSANILRGHFIIDCSITGTMIPTNEAISMILSKLKVNCNTT